MKVESLSDCERHLDDLKSGHSAARSNWQSIDVIEWLLAREKCLDELLKLNARKPKPDDYPKSLADVAEKFHRGAA